MNYPSGDTIKIGDTLKLWKGCKGTVVCSMDDGEYSDNYTEKDWSYLKKGVLINTDVASLIHYTEPENGFKLISRGIKLHSVYADNLTSKEIRVDYHHQTGQ